jgi:hypothetical protein
VHVARKFCPETIGLWIGGTGLGGLLADDLLDQAWRAVPTVPGQIHADILQVTLALVTVCAVFRWAINPVREAFIFGWHARGEHDERRRTSSEDATVLQMPARVFASDLAPAVPDNPTPRHRAARRPLPRR